jgi:predicted RecA/RadA family phage recombinase
MRNYVQRGDALTIPAPTGGVSSGDAVLVGALFGVAAATADAGDDVAVSVEGVFELPKKAADAVTVGAVLYWDATPGELTTTGTDNVRVGYAAAAAGAGTTTVTVKLTPGAA